MNAQMKAKQIVTTLSQECSFWIEAFRFSTKQRVLSMNDSQVETFREIVSTSVPESDLDNIKQDIMIKCIDDRLKGLDGALVESSKFVEGDL